MYKKGDILLIDLGEVPYDVVGHEQGGKRPCLVLADYGGSIKLVLIAPRTTSNTVAGWPHCVNTPAGIGGLDKPGYIMLHQTRTVSHDRIIKKIGSLPDNIMNKVDTVLIEMLDL